MTSQQFKAIEQLLQIQENLPFGADSFVASDEDANGNFQTYVFSKGGAVIKTVLMTYNASDNVQTYSES